MIPLNPRSPIPLYRQLADALREGIRRGEYPAGSRIPSEHELAARFGIGRPTVRQATELLIRQHLLTRRRGAGTFVCDPPREVDLFSLAGTSAAFEEKGLDVKTRYLAPLELRQVPAAPGNPFGGRQAYSLSRVHRVGSEPILLEDIYLDADVFRGIDRFDLRSGSLSRIVAEHYYLRPERVHQSFRIRTLKGPPARALQVTPAAPVLHVRRRLHFPRAGSAVYAELYCRTDRFEFSQTFSRSFDSPGAQDGPEGALDGE
ncbi:MAG TPA: GntR family transcriptional regulator [Gammaproteobacteria bacterium]